MIRFARENEVEILKGLYMSCFEDSEAFARALFSRLFKPENCLVREEDGQPVAMLFLINPLKEVGYIRRLHARRHARAGDYERAGSPRRR